MASDMNAYNTLLGNQQSLTNKEMNRSQQLTEEELRQRKERKAREKAIQGGGRVGLMFGGNEQGVV